MNIFKKLMLRFGCIKPRTYKDMMKIIAPKNINEKYGGGVRGCPGHIFEDAPYCSTCGGYDCRLCWNKEYKGEKIREN